MQSDSKVSSFLLLILVGLSIYLLYNQKEKFNNTSEQNVIQEEHFDDIESSQPFGSQQYAPASQQYVADSQHYESDSQHYVPDSQQYVPASQQQYVPASQQHVEASHQQYMPASQHQYMLSSQEPVIPASVINEIATKPVAPKSGKPSVYNFEANDDSVFESLGSNLNDAFAAPIPPGTNTNEVDFKKQNMDNYNAKDFLPKEVNDEWFETDFSLAKYQLNDDKLINTERYIIGINTVGQSLKNATHDIRGTVPNPKFIVSPWNNSTYEPDFNLKPLC
uniref:Minor capsid protein P11 C-terminal conserved region domain-containing protein n=1 Tax=viral metagenome TaxID=1070528 RepID=A0A6C0D9P9_9ZZZZ